MTPGRGGGWIVRAPLLTLVLAPELAATLAMQTTDDFEVIEAAPARGRWILSWWGADLTPLHDPAFVEKATVLAGHTSPPVCIGLTAVEAGLGTHRWQAVDAPTGSLLGVLVDAAVAGSWAGRRPERWRGFPVADAGGLRVLPPLPEPPRSPARWSADLSNAAHRRWAALAGRWTAPAWSPGTVPLWLVDRAGPALCIARRPRSASAAPIMLGRTFARPFWRTVPVTRHPDGRRLALGGGGTPLGYVMTAGLPGMTEIHGAVGAALRRVGRWPGTEPSALLAGEGPGWIDLPTPPPDGPWPRAPEDDLR